MSVMFLSLVLLNRLNERPYIVTMKCLENRKNPLTMPMAERLAIRRSPFSIGLMTPRSLKALVNLDSRDIYNVENIHYSNLKFPLRDFNQFDGWTVLEKLEHTLILKPVDLRRVHRVLNTNVLTDEMKIPHEIRPIRFERGV